MKQKQLLTIPELQSSAAVVKAAAIDKGAGIPLLHNTAVNIGIDADALTTTCNNHDAGKVVLATKRALLATVVVIVRAFLMFGRDILKPIFGNEYSQAFDVLGLVGSIAIPRTAEELLVILQKFKAYFTAHPELEDPLHNITAARAQELYDELLAALNAVNSQEGAVETLMQLRDQAAEKLRKRLRGVIDEMMQSLDPFDGRWLAFGFNMPGAQERPDVVENLRAALIGPTTAALVWDVPARADYYHVLQRIQGVDAELVLIASPQDPAITLENLPAGKSIDIVLAAVNNGGEGPRSSTVTIVTH
ncbi:MAG: hypothetical protein JWM68_3682 [Verrucomicrobiales bacterium]|nr:hypothetical protein [Verrucomicrobiales bacterium]